jgi:hypothetical protein
LGFFFGIHRILLQWLNRLGRLDNIRLSRVELDLDQEVVVYALPEVILVGSTDHTAIAWYRSYYDRTTVKLYGGFALAIHRNETTELKSLHGLSGDFLSLVNCLCGAFTLAWRFARAKPPYTYAIISEDFCTASLPKTH